VFTDFQNATSKFIILATARLPLGMVYRFLERSVLLRKTWVIFLRTSEITHIQKSCEMNRMAEETRSY